MFEVISSVIKTKLRKIRSQINVNDLIIDVIKKEPLIKERLLSFSRDFEKLKDPWVFDLVAKTTTLKNLAEHSNVDAAKLIEFLITGNGKENGGTEGEKKVPNWVLNSEFEEIDARKLSGFFLKDILNKEAKLENGKGLKVIQNFHAAPLISLLESKGYKSYTEKIAEDLFNFYFIKESQTGINKEFSVSTNGKPKMVVQSATPVVYPILLKLLQSENVRKKVEITEYKVWEETEKHLGWIVNGKADLSFSAILAMSNLANNKDIVALSAITVWDNFYLLTNGFQAGSWEELRNKIIHMPLFFNAPPAKVTKYLMKKKGFNPDDFNFEFGKPFGRPEIIYKELVEGKIDAALLREPEVSYALVNNPAISVSFSYNELWQKIHPSSKGLPNAGVVFKREWMENYPEEAALLLEEIRSATEWVKENPIDAAKLSYEEMGHSFEEVYKFLTRVHYEHVPSKDAEEEIVKYLSVIDGEEKAKLAVSKMLAN